MESSLLRSERGPNDILAPTIMDAHSPTPPHEKERAATLTRNDGDVYSWNFIRRVTASVNFYSAVAAAAAL